MRQVLLACPVLRLVHQTAQCFVFCLTIINHYSLNSLIWKVHSSEQSRMVCVVLFVRPYDMTRQAMREIQRRAGKTEARCLLLLTAAPVHIHRRDVDVV